MPSFFSSILKDMRSSMEVPTPPGFAPIAAILLPDSHKSDLSRLIKTAPDDLTTNKEWWFNVTKATGAKPADVEKVHSYAEQASTQKRTGVLDTIKQFSSIPQVQKDKTLQKMLKTFQKRTMGGDAQLEDILKMQKILAARLQRLDEKIQKRGVTAERFRRSTESPQKPSVDAGATQTKESQENEGRPISEDVIVEGMVGDIVSKMASYFASPKLAAAMAGDVKNKKMNKQIAKAAIYSLLQIVTNRAYDKLEQAGVSKRLMSQAFKNRNERGNQQLLNKAAKLLGSDKRFGAPPNPEELKAQKVAQRKGPNQPPPIKQQVTEVDVAADSRAPTQVQPLEINPGANPELEKMPTPDEKPLDKSETLSMGAQIYRKVMAAARAAKAQGQDPAAVADYVLKQYEEQKIPDAAIVRRMFERSKLSGS